METENEMSKKKTEAPQTIKQRFVACVQSTGRCGKSTVADAMISWLRFAGVPHASIDADFQHHTLSDRYPGEIHLHDATASEDEFGLMLEHIPTEPVMLVDFPGQTTAKILDFADHFQMLKSFKMSDIKPTLLIFTADDSTAKDSAIDTIDFFADDADYILVENSARFRSDLFRTTPLYEWFTQRSTPTVTIPRISAGTLNVWEAKQHELGRFLSLDEMCKLPGLHHVTQLELAGIRYRCLVQFEECAARIVPDPALIKNKVPRVGPATKRNVTRLGNPLLVRT